MSSCCLAQYVHIALVSWCLSRRAVPSLFLPPPFLLRGSLESVLVLMLVPKLRDAGRYIMTSGRRPSKIKDDRRTINSFKKKRFKDEEIPLSLFLVAQGPGVGALGGTGSLLGTAAVLSQSTYKGVLACFSRISTIRPQ